MADSEDDESLAGLTQNTFLKAPLGLVSTCSVDYWRAIVMLVMVVIIPRIIQ